MDNRHIVGGFRAISVAQRFRSGSGFAGGPTVVLGIIGDANMDGIVSIADFAILQNNFGQPGGFQDGDFNLDGFVTFEDFVLLENNFGVTRRP